jgi:uncharacterized protein (TIGR00266 family)
MTIPDWQEALCVYEDRRPKKMKCLECGTENREGVKFCTNCGAPLQSTGTAPPPPLDTTVDNMKKTFEGGKGRIGYRIEGTTLQVVIIQMEEGERVYSESGGMAWMTANVEMETHTGGGIGKMFKRALSGESLFITDFYTRTGTGMGTVAFTAEFPGKIIPFDLAPGQSIIIQKDAFMCAEKSVELEMYFHKKLGAGFFGGEGFIMQRVTGPGLAFAEIDGEVVEHELKGGETMKVDTEHVAMFEPTVNFSVTMVKGFKNMLFGGEGLFLATLTGPGKVWLQTMPITKLANKIMRYIPTSSS